MTAALGVRILGPVEVVDEHGPVTLGGPQQRRILSAMLADPASVLTFARMVEVLWPNGDGPPNARRSAISYVSKLRSALGESIVETNDAGYRLAPDGWTLDADRFVELLERARALPGEQAREVYDEALGLWRGPVFGDLTAEWWARSTVSRLEELRLAAFAERLDVMSAKGWDGRAIAEACALVDAHPLREQFVARAMRGFHAIGQSADALRVYQRYRHELVEQTGLSPSSVLVELESSILAGDIRLPEATGPGRVLRGYVLHDLLGQGSFGWVYRATQPGVQRDVAVKVVRPALADDREFIRRFEVEAQLVARLEHPHIVPLYDFWRQPGGAFLVFRLLRGGTAETRLRSSGPFEVGVVSGLLGQIGSALTAAHTAGVVHRDVKPANILFDEAGSAYLGDFGIAATTEAEAPVRWSAGSVLYASPEQLRDGTEDHLADQYALAVTAWELLAGRPAFGQRDASSILEAKLHEAPPPIETVRPDVPPAAAAVLARAASVHPGDRYASVAEFVSAWQWSVAAATADSAEAHLGEAARILAGTVDVVADTVVNPYRGLRPFGEGDAAEFRGRAGLVERLVAAFEGSPIVAVVGPSGSGKSSLVLAGLVPHLRRDGRLITMMTPGVAPVRALAEALSHLATDAAADSLALDRLWSPGGIRQAIATIVGLEQIVLVIDQFEELWTVAEPAERECVVTGLLDAVNDGALRIVATIRADFFDRPLADAGLGPLVATGTFGVTAMTAGELHDAITVPAARVGVRFEAELVSLLVAEATQQAGSLPLLQFTLTELFARRSGPTITVADYDALGGLAGSIGRQADDLVASLDDSDRAAVRRLFNRLVTPGEGTDDTRRRVPMSELAAVPDRVVRAFVAHRLLTTDRHRTTREPTVEVAHEALLRSWPQLRSWLSEERSWLRELQGVTGAAATWEAGGRDDADLYRGARLSIAAELAAPRRAALTDRELAFLDASQARADAEAAEDRRRLAQERRQNRRLRRALAAAAVLLVVAIGAGAIATTQGRRATDQRRLADSRRADAETQQSLAEDQTKAAETARQQAQQSASAADAATTASRLTTLAARSLATRSGQREVAALLAVEAWRRAPNAASKSALFGTFTFDPGFLGYSQTSSESTSAFGELIPGSSDLFLIEENADLTAKPAHRVDALTGEVKLQLSPVLDGPEDFLDSAVNANGRFAVEQVAARAAPDDVFAAVLDLGTGRRVGPAVKVGRGVLFAVDDDGSRWYVSHSTDGSVDVYDAATSTRVATIPGLDEPSAEPGLVGLGFGPDGLLYVGSRSDQLRLIDPATLRETRRITVPRYATNGSFRFLADGTGLVMRGHIEGSFGQRGAIARIDLRSGATVWKVDGHDYGFGECASFTLSEATDRLWCGDFFGRVGERSLSTGLSSGRSFESQNGWVQSLSLVERDGRSVLVAFGNNSASIGRWAVDGSGPVQRVMGPGLQVVGMVTDQLVLAGEPNGGDFPFDLRYRVLDAQTGATVPEVPDFLYARTSQGLIWGVFSNGRIGTFDIATKVRHEVDFSLSPIPSAVGLAEEQGVALLGYQDGRVVGIDLTSGQRVIDTSIPMTNGIPPSVSNVAMSPDGSRLYVVGYGIFALDPHTGAELARNVSNPLVGGAVVAPSGAIATSSADGSVALLDPVTLERIGSMQGSRGFSNNIAFDDAADVLLVPSNDGAVSIHDVAGRERLGDPISLGAQPESGFAHIAGIAPSGKAAVIQAGRDGGVVVWDLDPEHWVAAACRLAGRNLTRDEWTTYLGELGDYRETCPGLPAPSQ